MAVSEQLYAGPYVDALPTDGLAAMPLNVNFAPPISLDELWLLHLVPVRHIDRQARKQVAVAAHMRQRPRHLGQVQSQTEASAALAKALKKAGFVFVGPTTCHATMQAIGMVDDHAAHCFRRTQAAR